MSWRSSSLGAHAWFLRLSELLAAAIHRGDVDVVVRQYQEYQDLSSVCSHDRDANASVVCLAQCLSSSRLLQRWWYYGKTSIYRAVVGGILQNKSVKVIRRKSVLFSPVVLLFGFSEKNENLVFIFSHHQLDWTFLRRKKQFAMTRTELEGFCIAHTMIVTACLVVFVCWWWFYPTTTLRIYANFGERVFFAVFNSCFEDYIRCLH